MFRRNTVSIADHKKEVQTLADGYQCMLQAAQADAEEWAAREVQNGQDIIAGYAGKAFSLVSALVRRLPNTTFSVASSSASGANGFAIVVTNQMDDVIFTCFFGAESRRLRIVVPMQGMDPEQFAVPFGTEAELVAPGIVERLTQLHGIPR